MQRHHFLNALFKHHAHGQVAPWCIEAPEDYCDSSQGPYERLVYSAGYEFELAWLTAGIPTELMDVQAMIEVLQSVGTQDLL